MKALMLRFDAPLMSFGGISVDRFSRIDRFPGLSMMTGFLANALGWSYSQKLEHCQLQKRLLLASRNDRKGVKMVDYQTVSLGQDFMRSCNAWTTRGRIEPRQGTSDSEDAITIRDREFWADAIYTLAISLKDGDGPTLRDLERALECPERPLFIGRKTCIPSAPVLLEPRTKKTENIEDFLRDYPGVHKQRAKDDIVDACWPASSFRQGKDVIVKEAADLRDWMHNVHSGQRWICLGRMKILKRERDLV